MANQSEEKAKSRKEYQQKIIVSMAGLEKEFGEYWANLGPGHNNLKYTFTPFEVFTLKHLATLKTRADGLNAFMERIMEALKEDSDDDTGNMGRGDNGS